MRSFLAHADQLKLLFLYMAVTLTQQSDNVDYFASVVQIQNEMCAINSSEDGIIDVDYLKYPLGFGPCCGFCYNSADCMAYGSCCLKQYGSLELGRSAITQTRFRCVRPRIVTEEMAKFSLGFTDKVWMVVSCSDGRIEDKIYNERCTGVDTGDYFNSVVPVTINNVTYKNKFCAYCNGVNDSQKIKVWDMRIQCNSSISPTNDDIYSQLTERNCSIYFLPPEEIADVIQICVVPEYTISVCNATGLWPVYNKTTELGCQSFVDPFNGTYQNYFCYVCNTGEPLAPDKWLCPWDVRHINEVTPPFIALINLDALQRWENDNELHCNMVNQFQDKRERICRDIECNNNLRLIGQKCLPPFGDDEASRKCHIVFVALKLTPTGRTPLFDSAQLKQNLPRNILVAFQRFGYYLHDFAIYRMSALQNGRAAIEYFVIQYAMFLHSSWYDSLSSVIENTHGNIPIDVNNANGVVTFTSEVISYNKPGVNGRNLLIRESHNATEDTLTRYFQLEHVNMDTPCDEMTFNKLLFCPFITINGNEMLVEIENGFLVLEDTVPKVILSKWQYALREDKLYFCVEDFQSIYDAIPWSNFTSNIVNVGSVSTSRIVSFVCVCTSIACLFVTISFYLGTPKLLTQPGVNNVILCFSLISAQSFYQFGAGQPSLSYVACSFIGAMCHFCWLCVIFSMNACSLQMFTIFRNRTRVSSQFSWKTVVRTLLYVTCSSVVLVIINLVVSLLTSAGESSGYGGDICYLSDFLMHLLTFIIPTGVSISVNIFLFSYVVFVINRSSSSASALNQDRNYFGIYARLSTLTGLTWLFGYIYLLFESKVIEYLFIVFNGCQGVFIMVAFVLKKETCSAFCRQIIKCKTDTSDSDTKAVPLTAK